MPPNAMHTNPSITVGAMDTTHSMIAYDAAAVASTCSMANPNCTATWNGPMKPGACGAATAAAALKDPAALRKMGKRARRLVLERHLIRHRWESFFRKLAELEMPAYPRER